MFDNFPFNPKEAHDKLIANSAEIQEVGEKVILKRSEVIMLEAELMDQRAESYRLRIEEQGITAAKEWIRIDCLVAEKAFKKGEAELRNLMDRQRILEEVNNNYKAAIKLAETEIRNLNLNS